MSTYVPYLQYYIGSFLTDYPSTKTLQKSFPFQFFQAIDSTWATVTTGTIISYANDNESNTNAVYSFDYSPAFTVNRFIHEVQGEADLFIIDNFEVEPVFKSLKERLFAAIYYKYAYGNVTNEFARRLFKIFKDPYGTAIPDVKPITLTYDKYFGETYSTTLSVVVEAPYNYPSSEEQLVNPPSYTFQALPIHNTSSEFTLKNFRFSSDGTQDDLLPLDTIIGEEMVIPPGEKRSISIWYKIEVN